MRSARRNRDDARQARYLNRRGLVLNTPIAELSFAVSLQAPDRAVALQGERVVLAGSDRGHARKAARLHGCLPENSRPVAQLTFTVHAPCPHGAIAPQYQ